MDKWDKMLFFGGFLFLAWGFSKQLEGIHKVLVEIRTALWNQRR